jgi:hypothetical protein
MQDLPTSCRKVLYFVNKGRKDRRTNMEIKNTYAAVQDNKFIKSVDRADQYLSFYSVLRKTVKWSKNWYYIC